MVNRAKAAEVSLDAELAARLTAGPDTALQQGHLRLPAFDYYPGRVIAGAAFPLFNADLGGPRAGYFWAVQFVSLNGLAGAADTAGLYIGKGPADVQLQNLFAPFPVPVGVGTSGWFSASINPGRTDLILRDGDSLIASGTSASTALVLRFTFIQAQIRHLDRFLP